MDLNPYRVLGVNQKTFTYEDLRRNYKKLVLKYHPDRRRDTIEASPVFQTLTFCYNYLIEELKKRVVEPDHENLKGRYKDHAEKEKEKNVTNVAFAGTSNMTMSKDRFDIHKFNQVFGENRIKDVNDDGYGDWQEDAAAASPSAKGKVTAIVNYKEPEPLYGSKFGNAYELGTTKISDFSGENVRGLGYMDFKLAHSTTHLVDPNHVEDRKEFKSVKDLETHRSKVQFTMSPEEVRRQQKIKTDLEIKEAERVENLKQRDSVIDQIYNKTHKLMLSAFGA